MSGSTQYRIRVNGIERLTSASEITLDLEAGVNYIEVRTDLECQGIFFETVFVGADILLYPNPTTDWVQVFVGGEDTEVSVVILDLSGHRLYSGTMPVPPSRDIALNLEAYTTGIYVIQLTGNSINTSLKVIKN